MLQPQTQKILKAVQPLVKPELGWVLRLPYHEDGGELYPFVWDAAEQGAFNLWNLLQAEGWSQEVTLETALENWYLPDQTGAVNGVTWLLPDTDDEGILLDEATKATRLKHYQTLFDLLQQNLTNLQAFRLSPQPNEGKDNAEVYATVVLVGQAADGWIGVMPTVPHATPDRDFPFQTSALSSNASANVSLATALEPQLQAILAQLGTIQIYGYYSGGYDQVHAHRLIYALGATQTAAIEQTLYLAGAAETRTFDRFKPKQGEDAEQISQIESLDQLLHQAFPQLRLDRICFWNQESFYVSGEVSGEQSGDRVGVVLRSRFTYNP